MKESRAAPGKAGNRASALLSAYGIYVAFAALCGVLAILSPFFFTVRNVLNVLNQVSIIGIIALGSTIVLVAGGLDLSPGAIVAVSGVLAAHFAHPGQYPVIVPVLVALASGTLFGVFNGFLVAKGGIPAFIVTLGTLSVGKGLAMLACGGMQVIDLSPGFVALAGSSFFGLPVLILIFAITSLLLDFVMRRTKFGRRVYAVGGNELAAHLSGVSVTGIKVGVYALAGALSGFGGLLLASRTQVGSPISGSGYELDAIAAAVIGGTSTTGGIGRITGTIVGALIIQVISNGLDMLNVASYYQQIVKGFIIILAVYIDIRGKGRRP